MKLESRSARFSPEPLEIWNTTNFSDDELVNKSTIDDSDTGLSVNFGILVTVHPKLSIGAVYKTGPTFTVTESWNKNIWDFLDPDSSEYADITEFTLKVPHMSGIGVAFRATDFLTFTLDIVRIYYTELKEDFDIVLDRGEYEQYYRKDLDFIVDDATEIHFGGEYLLVLGKRVLAVRAGIYNDPDHTIRYTGDDEVYRDEATFLFPGGEDQIHLTGGLGFVLNESFQIDAAVNASDNVVQWSVSSVYRF
jgi:long-subunit fatty acid transport protein